MSSSEAFQHPLQWVFRLWREIHADSIDPDRKRWDYRPLLVMLVVAVSLTLQEYYGDRGVFYRLMPKSARGSHYIQLWSFVWWSGWRVLGFLILPTIVVWLMPGERVRDYGWSLRGFVRHLHLYLIMYVAVFPLVYMVAQTRDFQRIYPFYTLANRSTFDLLAWEALYAAQFVSLEFFFRGFMLQATKRSLGVHSIWVMIVPYCMIHYGKTFIECLAAIIAGLVLGTIALRTKSIWGGIFVHIAVATTMDLLTVGHLRPHP